MRKLATAAAVSLALASGGAFGLGLGEIEMQSALNQPMSAEIRLTSVKSGELDGMIVQLASPEAFARAGIDRSAALTGLRFSVDSSSGAPVIRIDSERPIVEPFLNFLLEVDWPQGRMVREYTVLLDPPVFMSPSASERNAASDQPAVVQSGDSALVVPTPIERNVANADNQLLELEDANTEEILSLDEATGAGLALGNSALIASGNDVTDGNGNRIALSDSGQPNTGAAAQRNANAALSLGDIQVLTPGGTEEVSDDVVLGEDGRLLTGGAIEEQGTIVSLDSIEEPVSASIGSRVTGDVTVASGDTLFEIASNTAPSGVTVEQMMLAILAANESSFINNNINLVRAGSILRIPNTGESTRLTQDQAVAAISDQNQLWQEYRENLRGAATTRLAQAPQSEAGDGANNNTGSTGTTQAPIETAALDNADAADGLSDEARAILETARQEILDGEELRIVADNAPADTVASATADETSESSENARIGAVNRRLQLAREELSASRLRSADLSEQASQLANTSENLESMVSLRQDEVARLETMLADARAATDGGTQAAVDTVNGVASNAADAAGDAVNNATDATGDAMDAVSGAADNAVDAAGNAVDAAGNAASDAVGGVQNAVGDAVDGVEIPPTGIDAAGQNAQSWYQGFLDDPKRMAIAGIGGLGLLGVVGTLLFRRKRKHPEAVALDGNEIDTDVAPPAPVDLETEQASLFDGTNDFDKAGVAGVAGVAAATGYVGSTTGPEDGDAVDYLDRTFAGDTDDTNDSSLSFDTSSGGAAAQMFAADEGVEADDKDDTISEVDVYLAYGLHGQAEELLTKAIERSPDNPEYIGKLLQTYHAQGNSEAFRATAADYHVRFGGDENPEWPAISGLGAELDPNEELYSAARQGAAGFGSGQAERATLDETDFTATRPIAGAAAGVAAAGAAIAGAAGAASASVDESELMDSSLDPAFAFDEGDLEATGDFSSITDELAAEDSVSIDDGGVNFAGSAANESIQEAADSLDLSMSSRPAGLSDVPDDMTLDLDQLSGDLELDSAELLNADLADLELPDLTADNELLLDSTGQFGTGADEMDTMMDLAKAYIDMGDKDSASSALTEIVKGGSPEQVNEAETLLRKIS